MMMRRYLREPSATLALVLGTVWTVTGNVAHAHDRGILAMLGSGLVPIALLLSLEIIIRRQLTDAKLSWIGGFGVVVVTFVTSYEHQHELLLSLGESPSIAALVPLAPDALMGVATIALLTPMSNDGRQPKLTAPAVPSSPPSTGWLVVVPATPPLMRVPSVRVQPERAAIEPKSKNDQARALLAGGHGRPDVARLTGLDSATVARLDRARLKKAGA